MQNKLTVSPSPHLRTQDTTSGIMLDVIIALIPTTLFGILIFGWYAALLVVVCVASAILSEFVWNKIFKKNNSLKDLSAVVTGLLLALNLPPRFHIWSAALGSMISIIIVKQMFGGLGKNFVNPALTARIVLMVSFPAAMTKFYAPFIAVENVTSATPLVDSASYTLKELFLGMHPGCIGETSAVMLLIGGLYLILRRVISPIIPVSFIGTVLLLTYLLGGNGLSAILSGGVMLCAIFMATDYVTSPTYNLGKFIFGVGCGIICVVIRIYGVLPEGASYALLFMNLIVPHINRLTTPKPFGYGGKHNA